VTWVDMRTGCGRAGGARYQPLLELATSCTELLLAEAQLYQLGLESLRLSAPSATLTIELAMPMGSIELGVLQLGRSLLEVRLFGLNVSE